MNLQTEVHNFTFIKADYYGPLRISTLLIAVYLLMWLSRDLQPFLIVFAVALLFLFEFRVLNKIELRLARAESANILASVDTEPSLLLQSQKEPVVMVAAHYDSAGTLPKILKTTEKYLRVLFPLAFLAFILFLGIEIIRTALDVLTWIAVISAESFIWLDFGWRNLLWPLFIVLCSPFIFLNVASGFYSFTTREHRPDSVGADDNASGVAAAMAIVESLSKEPPDKLKVVAAFWGVEEKGLFGSRQFVRSFSHKVDKNKLFVLNLDCVGVGNTILVIVGQGIVFRRKADPNLVNLLKNICDEKGEKWRYNWETLITGGSSDHAEWIENGFRAITIGREDYKETTLPAKIAAKLLLIPYQAQFEIEHIHSTKDTLEIIDKEKLLSTVDIAREIIRRIDQQL